MFLFGDKKSKKDKKSHRDQHEECSDSFSAPQDSPHSRNTTITSFNYNSSKNDFHKMRAEGSDSDEGLYFQNAQHMAMQCDMPIRSIHDTTCDNPSPIQPSYPPIPTSSHTSSTSTPYTPLTPLTTPPPPSLFPSTNPVQFPLPNTPQPRPISSIVGLDRPNTVFRYPSKADFLLFPGSGIEEDAEDEVYQLPNIGNEMPIVRNRGQTQQALLIAPSVSSNFSYLDTNSSTQHETSISSGSGPIGSFYASENGQGLSFSSSFHESSHGFIHQHNSQQDASLADRLPSHHTMVSLPVETSAEEPEVDYETFKNLHGSFPSALPFRRENVATSTNPSMVNTVHHDHHHSEEDESVYDPNTFRLPTLDMPFTRDPNDPPTLLLSPSTYSTVSKSKNSNIVSNHRSSKKDRKEIKEKNPVPRTRDVHLFDEFADDSDQFEPSNFREKGLDINQNGVYARRALQYFYTGSFIKTRPSFQTNLVHCFSDVYFQVETGTTNLNRLIKHFKTVQKAFATLSQNLALDDTSDDSFLKEYSGFTSDRTNWAKSFGDSLKTAQNVHNRNATLWASSSEDKESKEAHLNPQEVPKLYLSTSHDRADAYVSAMVKLQEITQSLSSAAGAFAKSVETELCEPLAANWKELELKRKKLYEDMAVIVDATSRIRVINRKLYKLTSISRKHWEDVIRLEDYNDILYSELYYLDPKSSALPHGYCPRERPSHNISVLHGNNPSRSLNTIGDNTREPSISHNSEFNESSLSKPHTITTEGDIPSARLSLTVHHSCTHENSTTTPSILLSQGSYRCLTKSISSLAFGHEMSLSTWGAAPIFSQNTSTLAGPTGFTERKPLKSALKESEKRITASLQASAKTFKDLEALQLERSQLASKIYFEMVPQFLLRCETIERDRLMTTHTILHRFHKIYTTFLYQQTISKFDHSIAALSQTTLDVISNFLGPKTLFGQYISSIQALSVEECLVNIIHDFQQPQPSHLLHFHVQLPCSPSLLQQGFLPSNTSNSAVLQNNHNSSTSINNSLEILFYRRQCLRNTVTVETIDPINVDEHSNSLIYPAPTDYDTTCNYFYPQLPLFPRIYRVDQLYVEIHWLRDQWLSLQREKVAAKEPTSTTLTNSPPRENESNNTNAFSELTISPTAKSFHTIYANGKNYSPFTVPQNSYVLALPDSYFKSTAPHNKHFVPGCVNRENSMSIHFTAPPADCSLALFDKMASPFRLDSNLSTLGKHSNHDRLSGSSHTSLSHLPTPPPLPAGVHNSSHSHLATDGPTLLSAPPHPAEINFNAHEDLVNVDRYTFVELITVPGQTASVQNHLNNLLHSGFVQPSHLQQIGSLSSMPLSSINNNTTLTTPSLAHPTTVPPQPRCPLSPSSGINGIPAQHSPLHGSAPVITQSPTNNASTLQQLSAGSPSRGYIPTQFLQPLTLDETSLVMAQCLIYPRLSHAFSAYLRTNHAIENLQFWSDVRRFRTVPWQLENLLQSSYTSDAPVTSIGISSNSVATHIDESPTTQNNNASNQSIVTPAIIFHPSNSRHQIPVPAPAPGVSITPRVLPPVGGAQTRHRRTNSVQSVSSYASTLVSQFTAGDKDSQVDLTAQSTQDNNTKRNSGHHNILTSPVIQLLQYGLHPSTAFGTLATQSKAIPLTAQNILASPPTDLYSRSNYRFSPEAFIDFALVIFKRYLHEGATGEVNLPGSMVKPLRVLLKLQQNEFIAWKKQRINILLKWESENPTLDPLLAFENTSGIFGHLTPLNQHLNESTLEVGRSTLPPSQPDIPNITPLPIIPALKLYLHRNIFLETEYEIYQLLSRDQFSRFKTESQYSSCVQSFSQSILERGW